MQANPTERLQKALVQARLVVGGQNPAGRAPLLQELTSIGQSVEGIMAIWDKMEKSNLDLQSVDANFYSAGEIYLDVVDKLHEALESNSGAPLDEVEGLLAKAGRQLITANEKAQNELNKLAQKPNT